MDLREALNGYVVTSVPQRRPSLSIVWSEADDGSDVDDADERNGMGVLAILDDYRITRVPKAS